MWLWYSSILSTGIIFLWVHTVSYECRQEATDFGAARVRPKVALSETQNETRWGLSPLIISAQGMWSNPLLMVPSDTISHLTSGDTILSQENMSLPSLTLLVMDWVFLGGGNYTLKVNGPTVKTCCGSRLESEWHDNDDSTEWETTLLWGFHWQHHIRHGWRLCRVLLAIIATATCCVTAFVGWHVGGAWVRRGRPLQLGPRGLSLFVTTNQMLLPPPGARYRVRRDDLLSVECDTTTIDATYYLNHTLKTIESCDGISDDSKALLILNQSNVRKSSLVKRYFWWHGLGRHASGSFGGKQRFSWISSAPSNDTRHAKIAWCSCQCQWHSISLLSHLKRTRLEWVPNLSNSMGVYPIGRVSSTHEVYALRHGNSWELELDSRALLVCSGS